MASVLIADDDRKIIDILRRTLVYEGYRVVTAADGLEALAQAQAYRPDLIVLDSDDAGTGWIGSRALYPRDRL